MTRAIAALLSSALLASCTAADHGSQPETADVSQTAVATQGAPVTPSPSATASQAAQPSATVGTTAQLQPDSIALSRVNDLRVRSAPGTSAEQVSTMEAGTRVFVLSGPATDAANPDLMWWEVVPYACSPLDDDQASGDCGYDPRIGWVTSGPEGIWLQPVVPNCPVELTADNPEAFNNRPELLVCFADDSIVLEGIVDYWCCRGITLGTTEPAWLAGDYSNPMVARLRVSEHEARSWGPELHINPESGLVLGERGSVVRITGHFDDPAAQSCRTMLSADERERYPERLWAASPEAAIFGCRLQFVVDAVEQLDFVPLPTHAPQG